MRMMLAFALVSLPLHAGADAAVPMASSTAPARAAPVDEFEVFSDGDALLLPVTFNGKSHLFLVDTGATHSVFDSSLESTLGERIDVEKIATFDGVIGMNTYHQPSGSVGTTPLEAGMPVSVMDLSAVRAVTGLPVEGALGMDFLRRHILRIDFDAGRVSFPQTLGENPGEALDITYNELDLPCLRGTLPGGIVESFIVDTGYVGAEGGSLRTETFRSVETAGGLQLRGAAWGQSASGISHERLGRLKFLQFGTAPRKDVLMSDSPLSALSLGFWVRDVVTFDFPNKKMYVRPRQKFDAPNDEDLSGLHILRPHGDTVVNSVDKGSPAESAGMKAGDVIVTAGTKAAGTLRLFELRSLFREKDKKIRLKITRGADEKTVSFIQRRVPTGK